MPGRIALTCFLTGIMLIILPFNLFLEGGFVLLFAGAILSFFQTQDAIVRFRWLLVGLFLLITALATYVQLNLYVQTNSLPSDHLDRLLLQGWALLIGLSIGLVTSIVMILLIASLSGGFILAQQGDVGTPWQAFRSVLTLLIGANLDWLIVANGDFALTRKRGALRRLGGPGIVIIRPGNAAVFERGGTVTRVEAAGRVQTEMFEVLREIVDLRPQFHVTTIKAVTRTRLTIELEIGIGYRIMPTQPDDPNRLGFQPEAEVQNPAIDLFPVLEETVRNAVYQSTEAGWKVACQTLPVNFIRDQLMATPLPALFAPNNPSLPPGTQNLNIFNIEEYARERANAIARGFGATITTVDIRSIRFPKSVEEEVAKRWLLNADVAAAQELEAGHNRAKAVLIATILRTVQQVTGDQNLDIDQMTTASRLIRAVASLTTDSTFTREHLEMLEKMSLSDAIKIINTAQEPGAVRNNINFPHD